MNFFMFISIISVTAYLSGASFMQNLTGDNGVRGERGYLNKYDRMCWGELSVTFTTISENPFLWNA